ncbi:BON domain protein [Botrimarina colliarenosi]|uniref:BON domain protein n=2 Tax=Botrimarina colliarenosi TaxID=2528001 RepID=A0A5C6ABH1_9BACT|nr:BON domain protein [Botrimarina colliarenosi]
MGQSAFGSTANGSVFGGAATGQNANQAFIGRGAADLQAFFGNQNAAGQSSQRSQRAGGQSSSSSSSSAGRRPEVRVTLTAAPELRRVATANRPDASVALANVSRLLTRKGVNGVTVSADGGVAVLEGVVATASERLLAEKLAAIEPGVRRVDNRLTVQSAEEVLPEPL